ncbi:MAG: SDR family oxidoreductase [Treponema sp.]|jgi:NAD(P)-dependent dehydrogenase (short-subunit alcohol dehydrogenase family)|nr:SDR family oxidoreductase [Treponema sp.]
MEISFKDKVAAVTGAGSGIGCETAKKLARAGASVVALDIDLPAAEKTAAEAKAAGFRTEARKIDITDEKDVAAVFSKIEQNYGKLDILVNSAGIITFIKMDELSGELWDRVVNVNLRGTFFCSREAAKIMKKQNRGAIVNISAGAAKTGGMNPSPSYIASKGGLNSLTFHFAVQLHKFGIRVNAICPGPIETPMLDAQANLPGNKGDGKVSIVASVPLGMGYPEDIAYGVLFLASDTWARYITGEILDINGGLVMD